MLESRTNIIEYVFDYFGDVYVRMYWRFQCNYVLDSTLTQYCVFHEDKLNTSETCKGHQQQRYYHHHHHHLHLQPKQRLKHI